jgi:Domain of unknown function (DUF4382)
MRRTVAWVPLVFTIAAAMSACDSEPTTTLPAGETSVLLTDAPFPYDSVTRVDVYIERIEASTSGDTTGLAGSWVTIAEPKRTFNLIDLQNGQTAILGSSKLPVGQYKALRMTLDTRKSEVTAIKGPMGVDWGFSAGTPVLYAFVEKPMEVGDGTGSIVIDFDVGRSFLCPGTFCTGTLMFSPVFRAVNSNVTGSIAGVVRGQTASGIAAVANAAVTVLAGDTLRSRLEWRTVATGKTDAQGRFTVAYLLPATYIVHVDAPRGAQLVGADVPNVNVTAGAQTTTADLTLAKGDPFDMQLNVSRTFLSVSDTGIVTATVTTETGPVPNAQIAWSSSNPAVLSLIPDPSPARVRVFAASPGSATVTAEYKGRTASAALVVTQPASSKPVATVTVSPASLNVVAGDSVLVRALLADVDGRDAGGRPVTWTTSDASVVGIRFAFGVYALLEPLRVGTATVTATSEGKTGTATVTVRAR